MKLITVPVEQSVLPKPRSKYDLEYCRKLGENIKSHGQKVPALGYWVGDHFHLVDGGSRSEGCRLNAISHLIAVDLGNEPKRLDLLMAQASIDLLRQNLPPTDRARLWQAILDERKCTATELAAELKVSVSLVGRYLPLLTLAPNLQEQINNGTLKWTKGSLIARATSDHDRQRELAAMATGMTRDALASAVRKKAEGNAAQPDKEKVRTKRVKCELGNSLSVTIAGNALGLDEVIEALGAAQKAARKARSGNLGLKTWAAAMRDRAKKGT